MAAGQGENGYFHNFMEITQKGCQDWSVWIIININLGEEIALRILPHRIKFQLAIASVVKDSRDWLQIGANLLKEIEFYIWQAGRKVMVTSIGQ